MNGDIRVAGGMTETGVKGRPGAQRRDQIELGLAGRIGVCLCQ